MKSIYSLVAFATIALISAGCGGGGSTSPSNIVATSRVSQLEVIQAVEEGFASKQQLKPQMAGRATRSETPAFYNDYYQVWVVGVDGGEDFFTDEALTIPAGKSGSSFGMGEDGTSFKGHDLEITAGPLKGYTETLGVLADSNGLKYDVKGMNPRYGPFTTTGTYVVATGITTIKNGFRDEQGNTRYYDLEYSGEGSVKVRYNSDKLFNFELNYTAEGTGTGTANGDAELLPATIRWDQKGTGTITFKDGSTQSFTNFRFEF